MRKMFLIGRDYDWIMSNQIILSDLTYWLFVLINEMGTSFVLCKREFYTWVNFFSNKDIMKKLIESK